MNLLEEFVDQVSSWPGISTHPHRFGGREFRVGKREVGHIHAGRILDIPFPRLIRDALLEQNLAEEHQWAPGSGWVTFRIQSETNLPHALWLMRLSYVRYILKTTEDPYRLLEEEGKKLQLSPRFRSLLEGLIRKPDEPVSNDAVFA